MNIKLFAIFDSKVEAYMQPFFSSTEGSAIRSFADVVNDGKSQIWSHPEDYTLFMIGSFDDRSGKIEPLSTPKSLGVAVEYVKDEHSL